MLQYVAWQLVSISLYVTLCSVAIIVTVCNVEVTVLRSFCDYAVWQLGSDCLKVLAVSVFRHRNNEQIKGTVLMPFDPFAAQCLSCRYM